MKIISWNVNGLRAIIKKGSLVDFLTEYTPDIVCLQEIKISEAKLLKENISLADYTLFGNGAHREGYSGTALIVKNYLVKKIENLDIKNGIGIDEFDHEGRIQILELDKWFLLNIYFPNSNHELSRLKYKEKFNAAILKYYQKLDQKKPVIITGDFNVAHEPIDLARPKENEGNAGYTKEERYWMSKFLASDLTDTFRFLNGDKVQYSWWSFRMNARIRNVGWRIDYFLVSSRMKKYLKKAYILDKVKGSDHCPVGLEIS
ncbi:exodeoxyribonuclease III [Candidatus Falkowbacteria bacterium CG_4_10_14_0_2_um_filter_41_15]|uniref:Exodeoxyribonuclease III n=3 Tax=Candidatus Falkowiibacteriota TaxID=1752728 RepID=A0A2G9ZR50_9BACT|nr:MAG: exodeoxyribonuclease III [Candidatus Falkowbacteria bacterium CG1_02_41_21]PIP34828.1 MAG: exodeoxyribonuclease III [Candidatus Falkowbacteria bacterium CG23_combo_of_CG06-09_8_20_14_all_41_10]PJA10339.1 MAG: exodeoxyribonuclease III [Candidatus Falkowbacteria bacterium CG_4_10_14_0_2_um_filter_41_15]